MMASTEVSQLLGALKGDRTVWAQSIACGHEYRIADSELFYGSNLTPKAQEFMTALQTQVALLDQQLKDLKYKLTDGFTKKSVEVKLGKTVEKICPILPGFPYQPLDCRALFDPIDYLAFVGAGTGNVSRIDFIDVKTGRSRLSQIQLQIRDAIEDGKVSVQRVTR